MTQPENKRERLRYIKSEAKKFEYIENEDVVWLISELEAAHAALRFYGDSKKYFTKAQTINLKQTTAVFHVDDPDSLPEEFSSEVYECSARLKVDQGKTARDALKGWTVINTKQDGTVIDE